MYKRNNFYNAYNDNQHDHHRHDDRDLAPSSSCDRCHSDHCSCHERPRSQGALVEKVICSKDAHKSVEFALPVAVGPFGFGDGLLGLILAILGSILQDGTNITVTPDYNNIKQETTVLKDTVINFGYVPAELNISIAPLIDLGVLSIPIRIFFQEHTHCPGARPGDLVFETDPVVEAQLLQPLIGSDDGSVVFNLLLFKAIFRTHITVVRQGIERDGKFCDLDNRDKHRNGPIPINSPQSTRGAGLPTPNGAGGGGGVVPPPAP
ncbi:hypothetical protein [Oceanobacillus manasiensis]|uniref:hypothetical protein n=1 Tax=Oceanobacillus manasiensis TaxID=586413 RepID=UPI0005AB86AE|nr:hypothetical protein [Oceanobacillus manasiensis]